MTLRILTILVFALLSMSAAAQPAEPIRYPILTYASDSRLLQDERSHYRRMAAGMAWRWLHDVGSPDTARIVLPKGLVESLHSALVDIYLASDIEGHDEVMRAKVGLDWWPRFYWTQTLIIDTRKAPWAKAWRNGQRLTDNTIVDAMMEDYGLRPEVEKTHGRYLDVSLEAVEAAQIDSIERRFLRLKGVKPPDMEASLSGIEYGTMVATAGENFWLIEYRGAVIIGDQSGPLREPTWTFRVYTDGRVEFVAAGTRTL
jgi:hypothetical protein